MFDVQLPHIQVSECWNEVMIQDAAVSLVAAYFQRWSLDLLQPVVKVLREPLIAVRQDCPLFDFAQSLMQFAPGFLFAAGVELFLPTIFQRHLSNPAPVLALKN